MEALGHELESIIETITPLLESSSTIVSMDDWTLVESFIEKGDIQKFHYMLTNRSIDQALRIQTLAVSASVASDTRIKEVLVKLMDLYYVYKERYERYHTEQTDRIKELISKKNQPNKSKKSSEDDSEEQGSRTRSRLSMADHEVKFQSDIAENMQKLSEKAKKLADLDNPDRIVIPTFNNTPIPLAMRASVEKTFPNVKIYLERQKTLDETISTPSTADSKSTRISAGSES